MTTNNTPQFNIITETPKALLITLEVKAHEKIVEHCVWIAKSAVTPAGIRSFQHRRTKELLSRFFHDENIVIDWGCPVLEDVKFPEYKKPRAEEVGKIIGINQTKEHQDHGDIIF